MIVVYNLISLDIMAGMQRVLYVGGVKRKPPAFTGGGRKTVLYCFAGTASNIVLSKGDIGEHADHSGISAKTGEIFRQHDRYTVRFDLIQHGLEAGTVKIRSAVSVVHEKDRMEKMMFLCKCFENALLIGNGIALAVQRIFLGQTAIERGDFVSCP